MAYIRIKRAKFKVEINKKGYPRVFKSFHTIKVIILVLSK